jgi:hypothetical protein
LGALDDIAGRVQAFNDAFAIASQPVHKVMTAAGR